MTELQFHGGLTTALLALSGIVLLSSFFITAPYGRYPRPWWSGPDLPSRLAWMLMELPQPAGFILWFILGSRRTCSVALVFLGMWLFHYTYRTFIYPFLPRSSTMSLSVVAMGFVLNSAFSYLNGRWLFTLGPERAPSWLLDPRFITGALLFLGGWMLCTSSDVILRGLRKPGEKDYKIPVRGAFRWVTSPNYLGEITMWAGWSMATWSLAGLTIMLVTAANLVPRARVNHRWYREKFPEYPRERKALIPFIY
jgi:3-oxo-5-alpha-steroid 4-dehydrogenase 1